MVAIASFDLIVIMINLLFIFSRYQVVSTSWKYNSLIVRPEFNSDLIKYSKNEINHFPLTQNEKESDLLNVVMEFKIKEEDINIKINTEKKVKTEISDMKANQSKYPLAFISSCFVIVYTGFNIEKGRTNNR